MDLISKYDLIEKIVRTDNEMLLQQVKHLLDEEEAESWESLSPALKTSINKGYKQSKTGGVKPHSKVIEELRARLFK